MSFEGVYRRLGVVIVEHALDEDRDLREMGRAFRDRRERTSISHPQWGGETAAEIRPIAFKGIPTDLADWLETHPVFLRLASRLLAAPASLVHIRPVNEANPAHWLMPWRQMRQIAVAERYRLNGFRNWSERDDGWLVEPPQWVLEQSVVLRVYLDNCRAFDGPVEVLTSSHKSGRLKRVEISEAARDKRALTCLCDRGDILAVSPLALRRRHRASAIKQRRVLEMMFTAATLPDPLAWPSLTPDLEDLPDFE
ncbi:MAG: hypothetical protein AAFR60_09300 [Pseudomonadota bacterium]